MNLIEARAKSCGWGDETILEKVKSPKLPPMCHCPPRVANRFGGMDPAIDLESAVIRCRSCLKPVGPACRTREVMWLRGLLKLSQTQPDHFDAASIQDKIYRR